MNVRITPRGEPNRTDLYSGVDSVSYDTVIDSLNLYRDDVTWPPIASLNTKDVAEIALDEEPGDWW